MIKKLKLSYYLTPGIPMKFMEIPGMPWNDGND